MKEIVIILFFLCFSSKLTYCQQHVISLKSPDDTPITFTLIGESFKKQSDKKGQIILDSLFYAKKNGQMCRIEFTDKYDDIFFIKMMCKKVCRGHLGVSDGCNCQSSMALKEIVENKGVFYTQRKGIAKLEDREGYQKKSK